ncbi:hypothetical protein L3X38_036203 [Prunus dulcis]|uniref:RNase H type-1 domain-containing protein n=1 Tax=Prunus dulcis TaxID=3755 RepID=A0AAD4V2E7_PRUDU|nr:hypothetical protein L3X38_036203 [Prunus dulcis]
MCVDYTNLNRACPKDSFPLPRIDQLVNATASHALLSFMDAYSGYNQIFMHLEDQAHTSFITNRGLYCYKVMPFCLKNVGATYQRLVNSLFVPLIGNTMEVYVDDILRGIEANPEKIQAILDMTIPKMVKDIQSLTGRVAALTRFISKATNSCAPFFKALKGSKCSITWTIECDKAFKELKEYMDRAPLLSTPGPGDILMIYLSVSLRQLALCSSDQGIAWSTQCIMLVKHCRTPRSSTQTLRNRPSPSATQLILEPNLPSSQDHAANKGTLDLTQPLWTLFVDGSSNAQGCGAGLILISPDKVALEYTLPFKLHSSNNEAEYEAHLAGLRLAKGMDAKQIQIFSDSQLVVHQVNQDFTAKDASMTAYLQHTQQLLATFDAHLTSQVPRSENSHADALARLASALEQGIGRHIYIEFLDQPSTQAPLICTIDHSPTWMDPILQFLQNQTLPAHSTKAQRVRYHSARYLIINGSLYKRGFNLPYLRCLTPEEGHYVLREIHEGICSNHSGTRSLAHKAIRQGYLWPSLRVDAQAFTQKRDECQRFANILQLPAEPLTAMVSHWPFAQLGLDLIGLMLEGKGQVKYAVVAVDYFTK